MSRKKIKPRRRNEPAGGREVNAIASVYPCRDQRTGEISLMTYIAQIEDADVRWLDDYEAAHFLMPRDYFYDPQTSGEKVREAVRILNSPTVMADALRRAIAILGHSPCSEALEALEEYGQSELPFAGIARLAHSECVALASGPLELADQPSC